MIDIKVPKTLEESYRMGFEAGEEAGYQVGYSDGLTEGIKVVEGEPK